MLKYIVGLRGASGKIVCRDHLCYVRFGEFKKKLSAQPEWRKRPASTQSMVEKNFLPPRNHDPPRKNNGLPFKEGVVIPEPGILLTFLAPEQGIRFGFSIPQQSGKFKMPVAHTCQIKVEFLSRGMLNIDNAHETEQTLFV